MVQFVESAHTGLSLAEVLLWLKKKKITFFNKDQSCRIEMKMLIAGRMVRWSEKDWWGMALKKPVLDPLLTANFERTLPHEYWQSLTWKNKWPTKNCMLWNLSLDSLGWASPLLSFRPQTSLTGAPWFHNTTLYCSKRLQYYFPLVDNFWVIKWSKCCCSGSK